MVKKEDLIPGKTYYYYMITLSEPYVNLEHPIRIKNSTLDNIFNTLIPPSPVIYNRSYYFTEEDGSDLWCSGPSLSRIYENPEDCIKAYNSTIDFVLNYIRGFKKEITKMSKAEILLW